MQHWRDSFALFEHALAVTTGNAVAHLQLGSAYLAAGDADAAERHYAQAAAIEPSRAPARLGLADVRAPRGDLAGAIAAYERELQRHPNDPLVAGRYGLALLRAGRIAQARAPLELAVAGRPGSATLHVALAVVYGSLGRTRDAIASNRAALRLDPSSRGPRTTSHGCSPPRADASTEERQEAILLAERATRGAAPRTPRCSIPSPPPTQRRAASTRRSRRPRARRASAEASGQPQLAREIRERGALYAARRAYVEPSPRLPTGAEAQRAQRRPESAT